MGGAVVPFTLLFASGHTRDYPAYETTNTHEAPRRAFADRETMLHDVPKQGSEIYNIVTA